MKLGVQQVEPFFGRLLRLMHCWHYYMMGLHRKIFCCQFCLDNFTHVAFVESWVFLPYVHYVLFYLRQGYLALHISLWEREQTVSSVTLSWEICVGVRACLINWLGIWADISCMGVRWETTNSAFHDKDQTKSFIFYFVPLRCLWVTEVHMLRFYIRTESPELMEHKAITNNTSWGQINIV